VWFNIGPGIATSRVASGWKEREKQRASMMQSSTTKGAATAPEMTKRAGHSDENTLCKAYKLLLDCKDRQQTPQRGRPTPRCASLDRALTSTSFMSLKLDLEQATTSPPALAKLRKRFYLLPCLLIAAALCQLDGQLPSVVDTVKRLGPNRGTRVSYIRPLGCFLADQNHLQIGVPLAPGLAWSPCPDVTDTLCSYLTVPLGTYPDLVFICAFPLTSQQQTTPTPTRPKLSRSPFACSLPRRLPPNSSATSASTRVDQEGQATILLSEPAVRSPPSSKGVTTSFPGTLGA